MINKILQEHLNKANNLGLVDKGDIREVLAQALTAIYEIGLGVIGKDEPEGFGGNDPSVFPNDRNYLATENNELRASQRRAWAKACGVAEK